MTKPTGKSQQSVRSAAWSSRSMPTMDDVARLTGFSQMTVSRAFLDASPIKKETRDRILEAAAELGYFHNKTASSLASQRLRAFGIILPTCRTRSIFRSSQAPVRFSRRTARTICCRASTMPQARSQAIGPLVSQRVRAILLPSIGHTSETARLLRAIPIPIIEVGNLPKRPIHFAVGHSDFEAGYMATRRLIETGRTAHRHHLRPCRPDLQCPRPAGRVFARR
jgi:LacI family gluconate utilization system Gnt-I transcriptional repressor